MLNRTGSTLVEVLVAAALLIAVMLCVMNIFPASLLASHHAEIRQVAASMAQSQLELTRSTPFASLHPGAPQPGASGDYKGVNFKSTVEIYQPKADDNKLLGIRVKVAWSERGNSYELLREVQIARI
jgi:hypothetical protein